MQPPVPLPQLLLYLPHMVALTHHTMLIRPPILPHTDLSLTRQATTALLHHPILHYQVEPLQRRTPPL